MDSKSLLIICMRNFSFRVICGFAVVLSLVGFLLLQDSHTSIGNASESLAHSLSIKPMNLPGLVCAANTFASIGFHNADNPSGKVLLHPAKDTPQGILLSEILGEWEKREAAWNPSYTFVVQNHYPNQHYGVDRDHWFHEAFEDETFLFVTEPIAVFKDRSLIIQTFVAPMRTLVYVLDTNLSPVLVYCSMDTPKPNLSDVSLVSDLRERRLKRVNEMIYKSPGTYVLVEYSAPQRGNATIREIELMAQDDQITLRVIGEEEIINDDVHNR